MSDKDVVITIEEKGEGAQFILGADGELGVSAYWGNDGHMYYLSKDEARSIAEDILAWAGPENDPPVGG